MGGLDDIRRIYYAHEFHRGEVGMKKGRMTMISSIPINYLQWSLPCEIIVKIHLLSKEKRPLSKTGSITNETQLSRPHKYLSY